MTIEFLIPPAEDRSGLLVPIPEVEPILGELRRQHDPAAEMGVPAHVTILFPFVARQAVDASLHEALTQLFAGLPAFDYRFERVERFGESTVFLVPEPAAPFVEMTRAVAEQWPEFPPYAGAHAEIVPHLTIGDRLPEGLAHPLAKAVSEELTEHGPIEGRATAVELLAQAPNSRWITRARYPLAA